LIAKPFSAISFNINKLSSGALLGYVPGLTPFFETVIIIVPNAELPPGVSDEMAFPSIVPFPEIQAKGLLLTEV